VGEANSQSGWACRHRLACSPPASPTRAWLVRRAHSIAVKSLGDPHDSTDVPKGVRLFTPRFADIVSRRVGNYQANTYAAATVMLDQLWIR
jgi:hypothetical protein